LARQIEGFNQAGFCRLAAERAPAEGRGIYEAAEEAHLPLRQRVHANSRRLLFAAV